MALLQELSVFDIENAGTTVWLFKKSGGAGGSTPTFTGRWIETTPNLEAALKSAISEARASIGEVIPYGILAQNNEASALNISMIETHAGMIVAAAADAVPQRKVKNVKDIQNSSFYVVRLTSGAHVLHAVRSTDASWRSARRGNFIDVLFRDGGLALDDSPQFSLSKYVDFFIWNGELLIKEKAKFESILNYREAHASDFSTLQLEAQFSSLFADLTPLVEFAGTSKIRLRRACAIRQKGHYTDQEFIARLRQNYALYQLNLEFDEHGLIRPTPETCADIITALLDHRLSSAFSLKIYDVPDTVPVN